MRKFSIKTHYLKNETASCMISMGNTRVLISATVNNRVPPFLNADISGWITAEYSMLPRSGNQRVRRERASINKRNLEIERLIARSLRNAVDLSLIPGKSIIIDADVIEADGGTRTASINGGMYVLAVLFKEMLEKHIIDKNPIKYFIGAVSVGIIDGEIYDDIDYKLDSNADTDMNIVMNEFGKIAEIQATGEKDVFSSAQLNKMMKIAKTDINKIIKKIKRAGNYA